jgi:MFS transporter, DHA1 family, multidrug resistance protein
MSLKSNTLRTGLIIGASFILTQLALTLYLPSLIVLGQAFKQANTQILLTFTLTLAGYAVGQLLWGTVSDYLGRRPTYLLSLSLLIPITIIISISKQFLLFKTGLFTLGFVVACYTSVGNAYIRDIYNKQQAATVMSYIGIALAITPSLVPLIGSHIITWFSWRAIFIILTLLSSIYLMILILFMPTTSRAHTQAPIKDKQPLCRIIWNMLSQAQYLAYLTTLGLTFGILMSYYNIAPHLFVTIMHLSIRQFGLVSIPIGASYTISTIIVSYYIKKHSANKILYYGTVITMIGCGLWLLQNLLAFNSISSLLVPLCIIMFGVGLTVPTCKIGAMMHFKTRHGTAASLMKATQIGITLACTSCTAWISSLKSMLPITGFLFSLSILALFLLLLLKYRHSLDRSANI